MSLDNNSANNFQDFLDAIKPYLNYQLYDMSGMGVEAFQFSTDEKPVGQWIDRKILYAKTVDCGALLNKAIKTVAHNISNIDKIISCNGVGINSSSTVFTPIPFAHDTNVNYQICLYADTTNITIGNRGDDRSSITSSYVTLFYTKTTDTALDSNERFAGLTASGEVVYERTISITTARNVTTNSWNVIDEADSFMGTVDKLICGNVKRNDDCASMPCEFNKNNNHLRIDPWKNDYFNTQTRITIRYTKSS